MQSRSIHIAERKLRSMIQSSSGSHLPSFVRLGADLKISRTVLLAAARNLRDQGLIDFRQGSLITIKGCRTEEEPRSASQRLFRLIENGIKEGRYPAGRPLPKRHYFAVTDHISLRTVTRALRQLVDAGLIRKEGKVFVVGRERKTVQAGPKAVILIIESNTKAWRGVCDSVRTGAFGVSFVAQARQFSVVLMRVSRHADGGYRTPFEDKSFTLQELVGILGAAYAGALVVGKKRDMPGIESLALDLSKVGRPVVWLDDADEGWGLRGMPPTVTRCHYAQVSGIRTAIDALEERGLDRALYAGDAGGGWQHNRFLLLQAEGRRRKTPIEITLRNHLDIGCRHGMTAGVAAAYAAVKGCGIRPIEHAVDFFGGAREAAHFDGRYPDLSGVSDAALRRLAAVTRDFDESKSLSDTVYSQAKMLWDGMNYLPLVSSPPVRAVIVPNDKHAPLVSNVLHAFGPETARRTTIISFDNSRYFHNDIVLSVDFGFDYLGYQAFHTILGAVPTARNSRGDIAGKASVADTVYRLL